MFDQLGEQIEATIEDLEKMEEKRKVDEKKKAEVSEIVAKTMATEGWKAIQEYIEKTIKDYNCSPHVYSNNPDAAHAHSGAIFALEEILEWAKSCNDYVNKNQYDGK